jgi:hypothetical protein
MGFVMTGMCISMEKTKSKKIRLMKVCSIYSLELNMSYLAGGTVDLMDGILI